MLQAVGFLQTNMSEGRKYTIWHRCKLDKGRVCVCGGVNV